MFEHNKKQYIFKLSNGRTVNIFYKENSGIYISTLNKRNLWTEATPLVRDAMPGFSADMDKNDKIYIVFQDQHGNIVRGSYSGDNWNVKTVLNSKNPSSYDKHLYALCIEDRVFYFYVLEYSGNKLLSYQIQSSNGNLSTPKVIDYVSGATIPFTVIHKPQNELYIFYKSNEKKSPLLGFKNYSFDKDQWGDFKSISNETEEGNIVSTISDSDGNLHLLWQKKHPEKFELIYNCLHPGAEVWANEKILTSSPQPFYNSSFVQVNDLLLCYWLKDNSIYYATTSTKGGFWSKQNKYGFYETKPIYCIKYKQNTKNTNAPPYLWTLPGNFVGGYKLAFLNDSDLKAGIPDMEEVRSTFSETLKFLTKDMEELKQSVEDLKNHLQELDIKQEQNDMELSKISIKASLLDNEMSKIKTRMEPSLETKGIKTTSVKGSAAENMHPQQSTANFSFEAASDPTPTVSSLNPNMNGSASMKTNGKTPVMPGAGFASITPEFLQGLSKR